MVAAINSEPAEREALKAKYGQVWSTTEVTQDFEITGFMAPFVIVTREADGVKGTLMFQHSPRFYFKFEPARRI
jgi:hypothetical protein